MISRQQRGVLLCRVAPFATGPKNDPEGDEAEDGFLFLTDQDFKPFQVGMKKILSDSRLQEPFRSLNIVDESIYMEIISREG